MKPSCTAQASVSAGMGNWMKPAQTSELVAFIWLKLNRKGLSFEAFKVSKSRNVWNRHGFESNPEKDTPPCLGGLCTGREAGDDGSCCQRLDGGGPSTCQTRYGSHGSKVCLFAEYGFGISAHFLASWLAAMAWGLCFLQQSKKARMYLLGTWARHLSDGPLHPEDPQPQTHPQKNNPIKPLQSHYTIIPCPTTSIYKPPSSLQRTL